MALVGSAYSSCGQRRVLAELGGRLRLADAHGHQPDAGGHELRQQVSLQLTRQLLAHESSKVAQEHDDDTVVLVGGVGQQRLEAEGLAAGPVDVAALESPIGGAERLQAWCQGAERVGRGHQRAEGCRAHAAS